MFKECLKNTYKNTGLSNLLIARTLLSIGKKFRSNISKFCPIIYKNWSENCKRQQFEKELNEFIHILDEVINQHRDKFDK
jgi:thiaminase